MISTEKIIHILLPFFVAAALVYMSCCGKPDNTYRIGFNEVVPAENGIDTVPQWMNIHYYRYDGHIYLGYRIGTNAGLLTHSGTCTNPVHFQNCKFQTYDQTRQILSCNFYRIGFRMGLF